MYQDYIITAIFLLIVALVIGGLTIRRYNIPYLYFLGGTLIGATFFTDPVLIGNVSISFLYPWFLPLLFLVGPGLYGSFCTIKERRDKWHLIHYLPVFIGYIILIIHIAGFNDHFYETVQQARELKWVGTEIFWPLSDKWILLAYPFHVLLYIMVSVNKLNTRKARVPFYVLPVFQAVFLVPYLDIIYNFVEHDSLFFASGETLRYIMFGNVFLIFWDVVNIRPRMQKEKEDEIKAYEAEKEAERQAALVQDAPKEIYPNAGKITNRDFVLYIDELIQGNEELPFNKHSKKANFIKKSPFKSTEWDNFFFDTSTNFGFFKKFIRIQRAIGLIKEGCLENGSVEILAKTVGYSSRAPFYLAFEQIMGKSLTDYREDGEE
jgi:AraC-like DNA-binding protein